MKYYQSIFYISFTIITNLLFYSCKEKREDHNGKFATYKLSEDQRSRLKEFSINTSKAREIVIDNFDKELSSNIVINSDYIKLQTNKESLIGEISKVIMSDKYIYVLDRFLSNNLFIFSKDGKFLSKVRNFGEGPNEILQVYDFFVDNDKNKIGIFDGKLSKIVYYNFELEPLHQKKIHFRFSNIKRFSNGNFLTSVNGSDNSHIAEIDRDEVLLLDSNLNFIQKGFKLSKDEIKNNYTLIDHLHQNNDSCIVWVPKFKNSIFKFNKDGYVEQNYKISFKKREVPSEFYLTSTDKLDKIAKERQLYYYSGHYEENDNTIFMRIASPRSKNIISIFVDKANNEYVYGQIKMDNLDLPIFSLPITSFKNNFVTIIEPQYIEGIKKGFYKNYIIPDKLKSMVNISEEGDNPIIQLYQISLKK